MRVLIRNTALNGQPLEEDGEVFTGETVTDVVQAMKGATLFSDHRDMEDYIDMVLRNAKMLSRCRACCPRRHARGEGRILPRCADQTWPCRGAERTNQRGYRFQP